MTSDAIAWTSGVDTASSLISGSNLGSIPSSSSAMPEVENQENFRFRLYMMLILKPGAVEKLQGSNENRFPGAVR